MLERIVPQNFIALYDADRLCQLPRYLGAMGVRARRGALDLEKDRTKTKRLVPYQERLEKLIGGLDPRCSLEKRQALEALFWTLEEFRISVFAPEIKTRQRVSAKRLDGMFAQVEAMV